MPSIRTRLLWSVGLGVAVLICVSGLSLYSLLRSALQDDFEESLRAKARALSVLVEEEDQHIETDLEQQRIPEFLPGAHPEYYQLWTDQGATIARSRSLGEQKLVPDQVPVDGMRVRNLRLPDGRHGRQVTTRFHPYSEGRKESSAHIATLAVARSTEDLRNDLARLRLLLGVTGVTLTLLTLSLLLALVSFGLAPLGKVAARIATIDHADLSVRLDASTAGKELVPVVDRTNDLLSRLQAAFARERALTADVAHELRTPLAGLATTIEVALTRERDSAEYRETLMACLEISQTTGRMVESLLALAGAEAGQVEIEMVRLSLTTHIEKALARAASRTADRALRIVCTLKPGLVVSADADKLDMILNNLIDNALTYVEDAGHVDIRGERIANRCCLTLCNSGCALTETDAAKVFDRFWRGDHARSIGNHAGLGLTLCRRLAHLMRGDLEVSIAGGSFCVTLTLPAAPHRDNRQWRST